MARMHWFWRVAVAVGVAFIIQNLAYMGIFAFLPAGMTVSEWLQSLIQHLAWTPMHLLMLALPIWIYLGLTRRFGLPQDADETHPRYSGRPLWGPAKRLHWFWQGAIACVVGMVAAALTFVTVIVVSLVLKLDLNSVTNAVLAVASMLPAATVSSVWTYSLISRGRRLPEAETCCRRCGYILRGLSEPRCSECGERI